MALDSPTLPRRALHGPAPAWFEPSAVPLWQALTSGRVVLPLDGAGQWCTVSHTSPFWGLFEPNEVGQRLAQSRVNAQLWTYAHTWSDAARQWAIAQVRALPPTVLQQEAQDVLGDHVTPAHRHDGLLAYAWWGGLPDVFNALRDRGVQPGTTRWRNEPLQRWIEGAWERPDARHHAWACALRAQDEQGVLRGTLGTAVGEPGRASRRL